MSRIAVIMGSASDWETLQHSASTLDEFSVPFEVRVISAHRTPELMFDFAKSAADEGFAAAELESRRASRSRNLYNVSSATRPAMREARSGQNTFADTPSATTPRA